MYPRALETTFNHLDSTSLDRLYLTSLPIFFISNPSWKEQNNKRKVVQIPHARSSPQPYHIRDIAPHPIYHLYTAKLSSMPRRAIPRLCTPLEEYFPWFSRNNFTIQSPCPSLFFFFHRLEMSTSRDNFPSTLFQ